MAKRHQSPPVVHDEDTTDFDLLFSRSENSPEKPIQRNAANARERARMRVLSKAFCRLKTSLPWVPPDTKLSKLDTLRLAATYIAHLRKILREDINEENLHAMSSSPRDCSAHPVTLTWPFTINSRTPCNEYSSTPAMHGNNRNTVEYSHEGVLDYRNLVPCEYLAMNQSNCQRKDVMEHYLQ